MPASLFNLPLPLAGALIIGCLCAYSLIGLALFRRLILPRLKVCSEDSEFSGAMVQAIMVFYGLAVALVAVSVWETHSEVSDVVAREAACLADLYRDTSTYPEPIRTELLGELHGYTDYLIDKAWPSQRDGIQPIDGVRWMNRFQKSLTAFEPETKGSEIMHAEVIRSYNRLIEIRSLRMDAMLVKLPAVHWVVIYGGAMISLASTFLFTVKDRRLHAIQVLLLAIFIGLVTTLVFAFDRPFQGDLAVGSEPYQLVRDQLMAE